MLFVVPNLSGVGIHIVAVKIHKLLASSRNSVCLIRTFVTKRCEVEASRQAPLMLRQADDDTGVMQAEIRSGRREVQRNSDW